MNLFEHINKAQEAINRVDESGIRDITSLAKQYKEATGYFHQDLDGVTSALGMKAYLERYGIKTIKVIPINYGTSEFVADIPKKGTLSWMVDFAHGKPFMNIHTDHHDGQTGIITGTSTDFSKDPANVAAISAKISPSELFPPKDLEVIKMIDSAGFAKQGINPDQVMNAAFGYDDTINVEKNHFAMGMVVNKLLLANKNKKDFLQDVVMQAKPSLISMYNIIVKLAKKDGFKPSNAIQKGTENYISQQTGNMVKPMTDPKKLKMGQSTIWGTTVVQYGGGFMGGANVYDRYTPFKLYPDADYLCIGWAMGLVQVSKNPFKSGKNPIHLGKFVMDNIMNKYKSKLQNKMVTLGDLKRGFEGDIRKKGGYESMGFKWEDFAALFSQKQVKGVDLSSEGGWTSFIKKISAVKFDNLSYKQKQMLDRIKVSLWDIIIAQSGGHSDITNIQGISFWGKDYVDDLLKPIMSDIAKEMKDKHLQ